MCTANGLCCAGARVMALLSTTSCCESLHMFLEDLPICVDLIIEFPTFNIVFFSPISSVHSWNTLLASWIFCFERVSFLDFCIDIILGDDIYICWGIH